MSEQRLDATTFGVDSAELTTSLINLAPNLVSKMDISFAPLMEIKGTLREKLLRDEKIISFPKNPSSQVESLCAIDGARIREQMYVADLLVSVATTVDGKSAKTKLGGISSSWADILRHTDGTDRLAEAAMSCQEIYLASKVPHEIRILDGSFQTPIMGMREGLFVKNPAIRDKIADMLLGEWQAPIRLAQVAMPATGVTLAVPKSDSATKYVEAYALGYGFDITASDRFLASQVLLPGEMLLPRKISELAHSTVNEVEGSPKVIEAASLLRQSVKQLSEAAREGLAYTTYFKPYGPIHSGNVIRFEYIVDTAKHTNPSALSIAVEYASILNAECASPHLMEPFAQWAVDRKAKNISAGTRALRKTLIRSLPPEQASLLAQNYRT